MAVGELAVNVTARTSKARKGINSFGRDVKGLSKPVDLAAKTLKGFHRTVRANNTAIGAANQQVNKLGTSFKRISPAANLARVAVKNLGVGVIGLVGVEAAASAFVKLAKDIEQLGLTANKLGLSTGGLAGLRHAAEQTGVSANTLDMAVQRMTRRLSEAAQGTGEARGALDELGLSAKRINDLAPDQQFRRIAESIKRVEAPADRVRLAFKLFDSEGVDLVNTLALGAKGLDKMRGEADRLGLAISADKIKNVAAFNSELDKLWKRTKGFGNTIVITVSPEASKLLAVVNNSMPGPDPKRASQVELRKSARDYLLRQQRSPISGLLGNAATGAMSGAEEGVAATNRTINTLGGYLNKLDRIVADTRGIALKNAVVGKNVMGNPMRLNQPAKPLTPDPATAKMFGAGGNFIGNLLGQASNLGIGGMVEKVPGLANQGLNALGGAMNAFGQTDNRISGSVGINRATDADSVEGYMALRANTRGSGSDVIKKATVDSSITLEKILKAIEGQGRQNQQMPAPLPQG